MLKNNLMILVLLSGLYGFNVHTMDSKQSESSSSSSSSSSSAPSSSLSPSASSPEITSEQFLAFMKEKKEELTEQDLDKMKNLGRDINKKIFKKVLKNTELMVEVYCESLLPAIILNRERGRGVDTIHANILYRNQILASIRELNLNRSYIIAGSESSLERDYCFRYWNVVRNVMYLFKL